MKKTTIWISLEGVPMFHPKGWPNKPLRMDYDFCSDDPYLSACKSYERDLAEAKKQAIEFEQNQSLTRAIILAKNNLKNGFISSNSFIEIEGEVTNIWQFKLNGKWHDFSSEAIEVVNRYTNEGAETRQVARLKPTEAADIVKDWKDRAIVHLSERKPRCELELYVEKYFGIGRPANEKFVIPDADYGQLVNLLAMFRDDKLAAANARIKELEKENKRLWDIAHDCSS